MRTPDDRELSHEWSISPMVPVPQKDVTSQPKALIAVFTEWLDTFIGNICLNCIKLTLDRNSDISVGGFSEREIL
jgi:hypothetical protein